MCSENLILKKYFYHATLLLLFCMAAHPALAQLEYLTPVSVQVNDSNSLEGVLLLTTRDNHPRYGAPLQYTSSLQIVDPAQPFPPIFFANAPPGSADLVGKGLFQDFRFQDATRQLTFFMGMPGKKGEKKSMYLICDTNFAVLDTFTGGGSITGHGFQINDKEERLYLANTDTLLDISSYTGYPGDTDIVVATQDIRIMDKNGNLLFSWNPLRNIPYSDSRKSYRSIGERNPFFKGFNWSHVTSVSFTHDGNIAYSYRFIGVGKINRQTGMLMWKLGGKTPTIAVPPGGEYLDQHDFEEIAPDTFSVFSNGNEETPSSIILYHLDEKNKKADLVKVIKPSPDVYSTHAGNYEREENGLHIINYGNNASLEDKQKSFEIVNEKDEAVAEYFLPSLNHAFKAHLVQSWKPLRPVILAEGDKLSVSGMQTSVIWYQLKSDKVIPVSSEIIFTPKSAGVYVAATQTGFGWLVTKPYAFK